jgi:hypothetical protein
MKFVEDIAKHHLPAIIDLTSGLRRAHDGTHEFYKRIGYQNEGPMAKLIYGKNYDYRKMLFLRYLTFF